MSQRYLAPTNLFYRQNDPVPENGFPAPSTGDIYFNTVSQTIRVFYEGAWHDALGSGGGGGGGAEEVSVQPAQPAVLSGLDLWVDTDAPSPNYSGGPTDHSDLAGLDSNDHPQYLTRQQDVIVSTSPASGTPARGTDTVWIQY